MYDKWIKQAKRQPGWYVKDVKNGVMLKPPQGKSVVLHTHHSKRHLPTKAAAIKSKLKKLGLDIK